ncbi:hypothetical protein [Paenibacillus flagellatus]|uniref:Uncharacterized protein n=1 Tax=Paenibacillus flagellatus TaxID=2211139 RepID=A0A2V5KWB1_9BACL|nr:hypothetical protein [Paenibacillus flagellatus]PYI56577.1 hypothetical protein DLM86_06310 [Paenibacillus flagellatus]
MHPEKSSLITAYIKLLNQTPDKLENAQKIRDFLSDTVQIKKFVPPTVEFVSILRYKKPRIHRAIMDSLMPRTSMHMVFQLNIGYEKALESIGLTNDYFK